MKLPQFAYARPETLADAVALLAQHGGDAKPIAGGQSLVPLLAFRLAAPSVLVDLRNVSELRGIRTDAQGVRLGAMVRWRDVLDHAGLRQAHPLLVSAVEHVAHYQVRNRGTIGGSLAHADPASELPGIAVTCEAEIHVVGTKGARMIPAADFFTAPLTTALEPDEIITELALPAWPATRHWAFEEFARRRGDFAIAGVAVYYDANKAGAAHNAHIGVIGMGTTPVRLPEAERALNGQAIDDKAITAVAAVAGQTVNPSNDLHASVEYRRALVTTLTERALKAARAERTEYAHHA